MKNSVFFLYLIIFLFSGIKTQAQNYLYLLKLKDKNFSQYSIQHPEDFLSQKAILRREKYHIPITYSDLPLSPFYLKKISQTNATIYTKLKWFNSVIVKIPNDSVLQKLKKLSFIVSIKKLHFHSFSQKYSPPKITESFLPGQWQIQMLNGQFLHNLNLLGQNITIAILDAGFLHADTLSVFRHLWQNNQIITVKNFVRPNHNDIFSYPNHPHGSMVLAVLAGQLGNFTGSAPKANYILIQTEDPTAENLVEEYFWAAGAQLADSLGADIISSSLGYFIFNDSLENHSYSQLNGHTTPVTKAALMAAQKGIIVVNAAGNEALNPWHYIIAPADADSILAVGAVDSLGKIAPFSSVGPAANGQIKPDIVALGYHTTTINPYTGHLTKASGTSFATPIIAGLTACLLQKFPNATPSQIITAILQSASLCNNPNNIYGYGLPDFKKAFLILQHSLNFQSCHLKIKIYPNPTSNFLYFYNENPSNSPFYLYLYDLSGKLLKSFNIPPAPPSPVFLQLPNLQTNIYLLKINAKNYSSSKKILIINK